MYEIITGMVKRDMPVAKTAQAESKYTVSRAWISHRVLGELVVDDVKDML